MRDSGSVRGAIAGLIGGLAAVAAMYVVAALLGLQPLPDLLQQPLLAHMPGPMFGFLIDRLQHAGKVLEEAGLVVGMIAAFAVLGAAAAVAAARGLPRPGLVSAALAWLIVVLVVLPLTGQGLLGLGAGPTTPLLWALIIVVYGLAWDFVFGTDASGGEVDLERRRLVTTGPLAIALASLGLIGVLKVPDWVRSVAAPPESGLSGPVPALTPASDFYRVSKNFSDPVVSASGWSLKVAGQVGQPLSLSLSQLSAVPSVTQVMTLECISNPVGGNLMSTGRFVGVPLRDLLTMAAPRTGAGAVNFTARDGFTESMPLSQAMSTPEIIVAHHLNDAPLPDAHGFPARVLIPGRYGMKGPKWLDSIEVASSEGGGFWEQQGWDSQAQVRTTSRFDSPSNNEVLRRGTIELAGVAFSGTRGIEAVEWSADGGRTWSTADLQPPLSLLTWVLWTASWSPAREGVYALVVRARDGAGGLQTNSRQDSFPSGATGYHAIQVTVGP